MKLTPQDHVILRNFVGINKSLIFRKGDTVATVSLLNTVLAKAKLSTSFEQDVPIYDLAQFLSALSLFEDPDITLEDKYLTISSGKNRIKYYYADVSLIKAPPAKDIQFPEAVVEFDLNSTDIQRLFKALGVMSVPHITINGDGEKIRFSTEDVSNPTSPRFDIEVGETDRVFKAIISADNFKLLPGDYKVRLSSKGISNFTSDVVNYYIAVDEKSSF